MKNWLIEIFFRLGKEEKKLSKYGGYREKSMFKWIEGSSLPLNTAVKVIKTIRIYDALKIREILRDLVAKNEAIFNECYITSFGQMGKSGNVILYEFRHALPRYADRIISPADIPSLPENSKIVFMDDVIGTGRQSTKYIQEKLLMVLNPSHQAFLLCVCTTRGGLEKITQNSNFSVLYGELLDETTNDYYHSECNMFSEKEKQILKDVNNRLKNEHSDYDKGLLIAFHYAIPNNTMPIIWKEGYEYTGINGASQSWFALLPRQY